MESRPRVILTGSAGRAGRALASAMGGAWELAAYSRQAAEGRRALAELTDGRGALEADALVHAAWSTVPATAERADAAALDADVALVERLLERCAAASRPPLFVFLSTGAVYGPAPGRPSVEGDEPAPMGRYAATKLRAEAVLRASGLPHAVLRISNLHGIPSRPDDAQGVIGKLLRAARTGEPFCRWGSDAVKDYLHGSDCFRALDLVVRERVEGLWNVAAGRGTTVSELVRLVEAATGHPVHLTEGPAVPWDVPDNRIDPSAFRARTGWTAAVALEDGLRREAARDA